jgi:hypothetical protein
MSARRRTSVGIDAVLVRRAPRCDCRLETRIHAETATFEVRASEVASPRPGGETFVIQGEPERRDPDRLVWTVDVRPA